LNTDGGYLSLHARSRSDAGRLVSLLPPPAALLWKPQNFPPACGLQGE